jgi:hypothetical protein
MRELNGLRIREIVMIVGRGTDKISMLTDKPSPHKNNSEDLCFSFDATAGCGRTYLLEVFGFEPDFTVDLCSKG